MTKYLRCHTSGNFVTAGEKYEVMSENALGFSIRDDDGSPHSFTYEKYANWFTLEDDEEPAAITVLPDESLGGTLREYREVKRKAAVGERIMITEAISLGEKRFGEIHTVIGDYGQHRSTVMTDATWNDGSPFNPRPERYVVLEPTDIILIGGERLRMVDRKAAVGERVIVVNNEFPANYDIGEVFTVEDSRNASGHLLAGIYVDELKHRRGVNHVGFVKDGKYRVLEPVDSAQPTPALSDLPAQDQAAANIASLALRLTQAEAKIAALESVIGALTERKVASGPVDTALPAFASLGVVKSAQQIRDEIVERAKADIVKLAAGRRVTHAKYVVNREKRTVVALIVANASLRVVNRGIAKCAPGDVFNAHIGRTIALHRALSLEVPAEYLSVPQPTEVRVGDIVKYDKRVATVIEDDGNAVPSFDYTFIRTVRTCGGTIIDDSREDGGQSAASSALKGAA